MLHNVQGAGPEWGPSANQGKGEMLKHDRRAQYAPWVGSANFARLQRGSQHKR